MTNTRKGKLVQVYKTDQTTNDPLGNAQFSVNGETITSDDTGYTETILLPVSDTDYELRETQVPAGYTMPEHPSLISVSADQVIYQQGPMSEPQIATGNQNGAYQVNITNNPGVPLPHTGGPGTAGITAVGALLLLASLTALLLRRRRA